MKPLFKDFCSALNVIPYNTDQCIDVSVKHAAVSLTKNLIFHACMHSCYLQSADIIQYTELLNIIVNINKHNYNNYS